MNFRPTILNLLNAYRRVPVGKWFGWVRFGEDNDAHAQWMVGNGIIINPPCDFEHPSRRYC
jgi:hypothetical protein